VEFGAGFFTLAALTPDRRRPSPFWDREDVGYYVSAGLISRRLADGAGRRRFQREAQMASSLNHPHILTVHDVGEFEGHDYLITEFVDGGTLKDWASGEAKLETNSRIAGGSSGRIGGSA
jgi:hypothetical protein